VPGCLQSSTIRPANKSPIRETNFIKDIKGTDNHGYRQFDTQRHTNPLEPNYEMPGNFFS
jgi:hypothetical protein